MPGQLIKECEGMKLFQIRPATPSDAPLIVRIDEASGIRHASHVPALVSEHLKLGLSWLAEADDGRAIGYAIVSRRFFSRPFLELLAVDPQFRREGVGKGLVNAFATAFEDPTAFTSTNRSNTAMQALLAKAGFEPSGVIDNLDPGDPELVFVRNL